MPDPKRIQKNKQILKDNKDLNFVKRINNPILSVSDAYGNPMTHFMTSEDNIVFPQVIENNGKLNRLGYEEASEYARKSNNYIQFPSEIEAIDYGKNYKQGTPLEEFNNGGKMKKLKKIKKYFPNGGNLAGDLGTTGIVNNDLNENHKYFTSAERVLSGIGAGLASAVGLGGVSDAMMSAVDTKGQLRNSKEFQNSAGITGGIASTGLGLVKSFAGMGNSGDQGIEESNPLDLQNAEFNARSNAGMMSHGGKYGFVPAGVATKSSSALDLLGSKTNKSPYGAYYKAEGGVLDSGHSSTKHNTYNASNRILSRKYADKYNYSDLSNLAETPKIGGYNYAVGGWIPPQDQLIADQPNLVADAQFTYGNDWYNRLDQIDKVSPIFDQSTYDPSNLYTKNAAKRFEKYMLDSRTNPSLPWKTFVDPMSSDEGMLEGDKTKLKRNTNQVNKVENTYSNKQKFKAQGGPMLTELNGGFQHEDPSMENIHQGLPVGKNAVAEVDETKFSSKNPNIGDFIFSKREKMMDSSVKEFNLPKSYKGKLLADLSKKIKNQYKIRPDDSMAKEAMDKQLGQLAEIQEVQKQVKAEKLMNKALELNPNMLADMGTQVPQLPMMGDGGNLNTNNPTAKGAILNRKYTDDFYKNLKNLKEQPTINQIYDNQNYPIDSKKKKMAWGGGTDPINSLYVGPQLQNNQGNAYSIFTPPNTNVQQDQYVEGALFNNNPSTDQPLFRKHTNPLLRLQNNNDNTNNDNTQKFTKVDSGPLPGETEEELQTRLLSSTQMPQDLTGINAGMYGLQSAAEALRLDLTPNSKLAGNVRFDRVNPYSQEVIANKAKQEAEANLREGYKNSGVNQSQYLSGLTQGLGNINQQTAQQIAAINQQGQATNASIQSQEAQINKNLELQRNDIIAQDTANRSNQLETVGAGLVQNMNTSLKDKSARDMDLYTMQFMGKDNYKLISTKEDAEKYGQPIGSYVFVPTGYKTKVSEIKKKKKGK